MDVSDRFLIPEKLYGRETEVQQLLATFERISQGKAELILVAGFSGIGKTAVVNEVHKPIVCQRGYFIKGKFDQFNRNLPFSAFVQAFRELMAQIIGESQAQLQQWQSKILQAVGENGQVLIEVIPELEDIIGQQPNPAKLEGTAAQNRFNLLFQAFIQVFTTPEHPLVIFLDDLQWIDSASLNLLKLLLSETGSYLLVIGAYRDNEVFPTHPLILTLDELGKSNTIINTINLTPLQLTDLNHLIADTLHCSNIVAQPLTELVYQKTQGNPFFATQFLRALHHDNYLTFNYQEHYWQCDLATLTSLALTDDVVEFMAARLQKLPSATQNILKLAACIGNQFDLATIAIISEQSFDETAADLWVALQSELVLPTSEIYKFFGEKIEPETQNIELNIENCTYKFVHDRVQQAAYSLIPEVQKQATHLQIGRLLWQNIQPEELEDQLFEIVNQLNIGADLLTQETEKNRLAQLNLQAGKKAKNATAYAAAVNYLNQGLKLLPDPTWPTQYNLSFELYLNAAEAEYLNINFSQSLVLIEIATSHVNNQLDRVRIYQLEMHLCIAQLQMGKAVEIGLQALEVLAINLANIKGEESLIVELPSLESLAQLPIMSNPQKLAAMQILKLLCTPIFQAKPEIFSQVILTMIHLCLDYGNSEISAFAYGFYGLLLVGLGKLDSGYQAGLIALQFLEQFPAKKLKATVYNLFNSNNRTWKEHAKNSVEPLKEAIQSGLETGELEWAGYCAGNLSSYLFFTGDYLSNIQQTQEIYIHLCQKIRQEIPTYFSQVWQQLVLNFQGLANDSLLLVGDAFNESEILPRLLAGKAGTVLYVFYVAKTIAAYHFHDYALALENVALAEQYAGAALGFMQVVILNFYYSLTLLANYQEKDTETQAYYREKVNKNQEKLRLWAHHAPMNNQHKYDLVAAEEARILGNNWQAAELYDQAISGAKANNYLLEESLANELAAKFYLNWGKTKVAKAYMEDAYYNYACWEAKAKTDDLEQKYSQLISAILAPKSRNTGKTITKIISSSSTSTVSLDLATVIKSSQAISRQLLPEQLIITLIHIVLENAGAERASLIMLEAEELTCVADCYLTQTCQTQATSLSLCHNLPINCINYVFRTAEVLVSDNLSDEAHFAADAYVIRQQPKSVLCLPLIKQNQPIGVLYLENNLTTSAFTSDRLEFLQILCAQAAISLENSNLYKNLQASNQNLQQSLETLQETQLELVKATEKLQHDALHDVLTNLPNRTWFINLLDHAIELGKRHPNNLYAVLFLDLDRFKIINDSLGHLIGDEFLKNVAQRLQTCVRNSDTVARFGGDEFAILLEELNSSEEAIEVVKRIHQQFSLPFNVEGFEIFTAVSIGITFSSINYQQAVNVLRDADTAMYHAKAKGSNRYAIFDPAMQVKVTSRLQLESDLRRAIEAEEFCLHYQPIISLSTGRLKGFEALVRWHHPRRGMVSPLEFIPIAEETGLIIPLGWWVLQEACQQLRHWLSQYPHAAPLVMNVNLSAIQLKQIDLLERLEIILQEIQIPRNCLKLEITESCILETFTTEAQRLKQLRDLGIRLCIDDFGTGYSSLSRLHEFPIDTLKIDRSFVQHLSATSQNTVQMIITLAHSLAMDIVAEGIETSIQQEMLKLFDCEFGQGYLFSRPIDAQEASKWLEK